MSTKPENPLISVVARRLRAVQAELGLNSTDMAEHVGASSRNVWDNWVNEANMPEETAMVRLCEKEDLTMDWIYRGDATNMRLARVIRLTARLRGLNPDEATPEVLIGPLGADQMVRVGARVRRA